MKLAWIPACAGMTGLIALSDSWSLRRSFGGRRYDASRALRRADAQAAIGQRHAAAEEHDQCADPDKAHKRIEEETHGIAAGDLRIAKHHVDVTPPSHMNTGLGRRCLLYTSDAADE